jgi:hypothetical protein
MANNKIKRKKMEKHFPTKIAKTVIKNMMLTSTGVWKMELITSVNWRGSKQNSTRSGEICLQVITCKIW